MQLLTKAQREALDKIQQRGSDWFKADDLPHIVRRPNFVCRSLTKLGYLEMRYGSTFDPEFRLKV